MEYFRFFKNIYLTGFTGGSGMNYPAASYGVSDVMPDLIRHPV